VELVIADQIRLSRTPDGKIWTKGWGGYSEFAAYRGPFDAVKIVCRLEPVNSVGRDAVRCDGLGVSFVGLPYYVGPSQYLRAAITVRKRIRELYCPKAAYLLRMPSQIGTLLMNYLMRKKHPSGVIVVADPFRDFERNSCGHPAWRLYQWRYTKSLRVACRNAAALAYVTRESLQRQYPPGRGFATNFSDVVFKDDWYAGQSRVYSNAHGHCWNLLHIGAFTQLYKGHDTLLRAAAHCRDFGVSFRLVCIGDGIYRQQMENLAKGLHLDDVVRFAGEVPYGAQIRRALDAADLFVLPSRTEGLPRALLEAMARALPCIATNVGGVPELLDQADLVPLDRPDLLAWRITRVLSSPGMLTAMSARNLAVARQYHWVRMAPRRERFLDHLRQTTESWLRTDPDTSA
jgi:glycosyltransferase involved in cell wall biosynthesis